MFVKKAILLAALLGGAFLYPVQNAAAQAAGESGQTQSTAQGAEVVEGEYDETIEQATMVFKDIMDAPEQNIPPQVLDEAQAVVIVPNLVKAGFIAGGRHGTGVMLNRQQQGWSPPIFVSITGASIGAQIGVTSTDVVLVFNNQENVQEVLQGDDFTLGADATVAAGPAGAAARATTKDAEIYSYKRSEGLFAGASLTGGVITLDQSATTAYYNINPDRVAGYYGNESEMMQAIVGVEKSKKEFVEQVPQSARQLQSVLSQYTKKSGEKQ